MTTPSSWKSTLAMLWSSPSFSEYLHSLLFYFSRGFRRRLQQTHRWPLHCGATSYFFFFNVTKAVMNSSSSKTSKANAFDRRLSLHRCLKALSFSAPDELLNILSSKEEHYFARAEVARNGEPTLRVHMSGTKNSRRFIHVYLWWTLLLGPAYPISDHLLRGHVWKRLRRACGWGIADTRGHHNADGVCINPHHYKMESPEELLYILLQDINNFISLQRSESWIMSTDNALPFLQSLRDFISTSSCNIFQLGEFIRSNCKLTERQTNILKFSNTLCVFSL